MQMWRLSGAREFIAPLCTSPFTRGFLLMASSRVLIADSLPFMAFFQGLGGSDVR